MDQFKPKGAVLVSPTGAVNHKGCWGSHGRDLHLLVTLQAAVWVCAHIRGECQFEGLRAAWPNKMDAESGIPWRSLGKLSPRLVSSRILGPKH